MAQPTYPHNLDKEYVWWTERGQVALGYIDKSVDTVTTDGVADNSVKVLSPHEVTKIRLYVTKRAETAPGDGQFVASSQTDSPEFPVQFHEAIVLYAVMRAYEVDPETIKVADYWMQRYQDGIRDGKRWADENNVYGFKKVTQHRVFRI